MPDLNPVFNDLKSIIAPYAKALDVKKDDVNRTGNRGGLLA
jgi:hypothetical protein